MGGLQSKLGRGSYGCGYGGIFIRAGKFLVILPGLRFGWGIG